jgi:hypothetical protein
VFDHCILKLVECVYFHVMCTLHKQEGDEAMEYFILLLLIILALFGSGMLCVRIINRLQPKASTIWQRGLLYIFRLVPFASIMVAYMLLIGITIIILGFSVQNYAFTANVIFVISTCASFFTVAYLLNKESGRTKQQRSGREG